MRFKKKSVPNQNNNLLVMYVCVFVSKRKLNSMTVEGRGRTNKMRQIGIIKSAKKMEMNHNSDSK